MPTLRSSKEEPYFGDYANLLPKEVSFVKIWTLGKVSWEPSFVRPLFVPSGGKVFSMESCIHNQFRLFVASCSYDLIFNSWCESIWSGCTLKRSNQARCGKTRCKCFWANGGSHKESRFLMFTAYIWELSTFLHHSGSSLQEYTYFCLRTKQSRTVKQYDNRANEVCTVLYPSVFLVSDKTCPSIDILGRCSSREYSMINLHFFRSSVAYQIIYS